MIQLLLCFALLLGNASAADKKSDKELDGFKGPVGSVRIERAAINNETGKAVEGQRTRSFKLRYSEKGELAERIYYNGEWISSVHFFHTDTPGVKKEEVFERNPIAASAPQDSNPTVPQPAENKLVFKHVFQYDNKGNRIENSVFANFDQPFGKDIYVFDDKGNNVEFKSYNERGRLVLKSTFTFDNKGAIATSSSYDEAGKLLEKRSYAYEFDAQGNWIKQTASKVLANGKIEPLEVIYRTISYFPPVGNFKEGGVVGGVSKEDSEKNINPKITIRKGGVLAGSATRRMEPVYPPLAMAARIKGSVVVEVTVDEEGDVLTVRTLEGHPLLKAAAEKAALG